MQYILFAVEYCWTFSVMLPQHSGNAGSLTTIWYWIFLDAVYQKLVLCADF